MPNLRFALIRHAQSAPSKEAHQSEWGLTQRGEQSCRLLAQKLRSLSVSHIYSSHEVKAVKTAELTAEILAVRAEQFAGLEEQNNNGVGWFESADDFRAAVQKMFETPTQSVFGVESAVEAGMRFEKALSELAKRHPAETTIGIATHGRVMTSFLQTKNLADPIKFWKSLTFPDLILIDWPSGDIVGRESFP